MLENFTKIMIGILIMPFIIVLSGCSVSEETTEKKPNIIFILTDDQRWDALGSNNAEILTPEMDKLAENGVKFSNAFVTTPICAVSRASILSGEYALRNGIRDFKTHFSDSAYAFTYPMQLKQTGYRIGFIGKYGIGVDEDFPKDKYDYWGCFPGQGNYWHKDSLGNAVHLTKILGNRALSFIEESSKEKPFCLSISFKAPHAQDRREIEFLFDSTYIDLYKDKTFSTPETAADLYWESFPEWFKKNNEARIRWKKRFSTQEKYQRTLHGYYRLIHGVDDQIGRIRKLLKETGQDKNTIIVFMGDNGFYLAEHGMAGKWYAHEESIRVPMIIYDPRVPETQQGLVSDKMVLNIDIAPTILDYAGINIPKTMQGKSIRNILYNDKSSWRNEFFFEHPFKYKNIPRSEGLVTKDWKYVQFIDRKPGAEWLYNVESDPKEKVNLADNEKYSMIKDQLKNRFEKLKEKIK